MANQTGLSLQETLRKPKTKKCWSWSIYPLILWIRILGVGIPDISNECSQRSSSRRWFVFIYGLFCFLIHVVSQAYVLYVLHLGVMQDETATASWNLTINFINYVVFEISGHLILLIIVRPRWITVMERFQLLHFSFNDEFYVRVRKLSYYGVIFITFLVIGLNLSMIGDKFIMKTGSANVVLINILSTSFIVYPLTSLLLFFILAFVSSSSFHLIQMEIMKYQDGIQLMNNLDDRCNSCKDKVFLQTFQRSHSLVCDTIDGINYLLGWALLLSTPFLFMAIINCSFNVFGTGTIVQLDSFVDATFLVYTAVQLTFICFTADLIRSKAHSVVLELLKLNYEKSIMEAQRNQIKWLTIDMVHSVPQLTANGYFSVNKKLILKSIGTTITYIFILFQFESSEYESSTNF